MRIVRVALGVVVAVLAVTAASAQNGGLRVRVYDKKDNSALPGAVVELSNEKGLVKATAEQTDPDGIALFPVLRAGGGYNIKISFPGYAPVVLSEQRVGINETKVLPVGMSEAITEKVSVVATREVVDLDKHAVDTRFSDEFIKDLPIAGRFYQNVLTLAPGVSDDDGDGNVAVRGSRVGDFKVMVGGISNVDPLTGLAMNAINPDSIEEIEVVTAGAGNQYGRAQGGYSNIVQKQGGNEFEGSFNLIYRSSKLDGNGATDLVGKRVPTFDAVQPAVSLSGPILKDKLWWFLAYEYRNREDPVNTLSDVVVSETTQPNSFMNLTWQASPRNKISFVYSSDPLTATNLGVSSRRKEQNAVRQELGGPTYKMQWTAPFSAKLLVDSQIAYSDFHSNLLPMTSGQKNTCVTGFEALELADCVDFRYGTRTGSFFRSVRADSQRLTMQTQAEIYGGKIWGMNHQFKMGFSVENERYFRRDNRGPTATFQELRDNGDAGGGGTPETKGVLTALFSVPQQGRSRATGTTWGLFLEDTIKPRPNLTIDLQVRIEREQLDSQGVLGFDPAAESSGYYDLVAQGYDESQALRNSFTAYEDVVDFLDQLALTLGVPPELVSTSTDGSTRQSGFWPHKRRPGDIHLINDNVAPFMAISWDPWSNGKTSFGVSLGRGYGFIPLDRPVKELEPASAFVTIDAVRGGPTGWLIPLSANGTPTSLGSGLNPAVNVNVVDRNLRTPYKDEFTFKIERELTAETVARFTYIKKKERDLHQDIDINHLPGDYGRCVRQLAPGGPTIDDSEGPDGILDDCVGKLVLGPPPEVSGDPRPTLQEPDGIPDAYVLNPAWGSVYLIGNFNSADYDGFTLELNRRRYRGWELNGSYTWSRAKGAADNFESILGDDQSTVQDEYGYSGTDRRHELKVQAATSIPGGFRVGGAVTYESGLPYSLLDQRNSRDAVPPAYLEFGLPDDTRSRIQYITHQRNDQRNVAAWVFDASVIRDMSLRGGTSLQLSFNVFDMLNNPPIRILQMVNGDLVGVRPFGRRFQLGVSASF